MPSHTPSNASFREAAEISLRGCLDKLLSKSDAVLKAEDIEAVHDMRVASRRLRASITVFGIAFPDPEYQRFEDEVKRVTQELGRARDLDVMIDSLNKIALTVARDERVVLDEMIAEKKAERDRQQKRVTQVIHRLEDAKLDELLDRVIKRWSVQAEAAADWPDIPLAEELVDG